MKRGSSLTETAQLLRIVTFVVVVAGLYFGRSVFIPLALGLLLSLLLAPVMGLLGRLRVPRLASILLIAVALGCIAFGLVWKLSIEFVDLAGQLHAYKETLDEKIHSLSGLRNSNVTKASEVFSELETELLKASSGSADQDHGTRKAPLGSSPARPIAVQVVAASNRIGSVGSVVDSMGWVGLTIIFAVVILMGREDLRNRFIHLSSGGRLTVVTQALDEATKRIQKYLFLQSAVNAIYGVVIGTGLYFIGIPDAWLWGLVAAILRFLPYVGSTASAVIPVLLSLAIFPGWTHALGTMAFFLGLEFIVANLLEPSLYGAQVGLSTLAILVAAVFWTIIWGLPGLILSTPLTVSLVVMGRYVPSLSFFRVLLGDEPEISRSNLYYQRLLASDQNEARQVLEQYLKEKPLDDLYSEILIPALSLIEQDRHRNELDESTLSFIMQSTRELIEELTDSIPFNGVKGENVAGTVICVPARDEADEIVGLLLSESLQRTGLRSRSLPTGTIAEMLQVIADVDPDLVCISALPPFAIEHTRNLYEKLRSKFPDLNIFICLWHYGGDIEKAHRRLKISEGHPVHVSLPAVIQSVRESLLTQSEGVTSTVSVEVEAEG
jgi:predicted PurR-regulated permease PerM/methanogenic corrinoid protein MtbC1